VEKVMQNLKDSWIREQTTSYDIVQSEMGRDVKRVSALIGVLG